MRNQVYFASFEEFNDPFEFTNPITDLSKYNRNAREELKDLYSKGVFNLPEFEHLMHAVSEPSAARKLDRKLLLEKIDKGLSDFGVLCLSEIKDSILMWSHYSNDHRGFCIEFENLDKFISEKSMTLQVDYVDEYIDLNDPKHLIDFYVEMFAKSRDLKQKKWKSKFKRLSRQVRKNEDRELGETILKSKHVDWSYEKEVRFVNTKVGLHSYNPESISRVIFGLRMSDAEKIKIKEICASDDKKHIKFAQSVKVEGSLRIEIIDI